MKNEIDSSGNPLKNKWFRLSVSVGLAFILAFVLLLIPITAGTGIQLSIPTQFSEQAINLSLPLGAKIVYAVGGITITKTAIPAPTVDQGTHLTYTLIVANDTGQELTDVVVTDTVPANTQCIGNSMAAPPEWGVFPALCEGSSRTAQWALLSILGDSLPDGQSAVLTYAVVLSAPLVDQSTIQNISYQVVASNTAKTQSFIDTGVLYTTTVNAPNWQISKSADPAPTVETGGFLTYTLTITNNGHLTTTGSYTITDVLPTNTGFITATQPATFTDPLITWVLTEDRDINEVFTLTYVVTVTEFLAEGTPIVNQTYSITGGNVFSEAFGSPLMVTVSTPVTLTVSKTDDPDPVQAGNLITYTLTVTNEFSSKGPASNVVVTDVTPANTVFENAGMVAGTAVISDPGVGNTGVITWTITNPEPMQRGETATLFMTVRVTSPLTNNTIITNDGYGVDVSNTIFNPLGGEPVTTTVVSTPTLEISKVGLPAVVAAGGQLTYTIRYTNTGNANATGVVITDIFPISTSYLSSIGSPTPVISGPLPGGWSWEVPPVAGEGGSGVITLTLAVLSPQASGTILTNTATIAASEPASDTTTVTNTVVSTPSLEITKLGSPEPVAAGGQLTYTILYTNTGNANATGVVITDIFPLNTSYTSSVGSPTPVLSSSIPGGWRWEVPDVAGEGGSGVITLTLDVLSPQPNGTVLTNTVLIGANQPVSDTDTVTNTVTSTPTLEITKIGSPEPVPAGGQLTYTIRFTNTGNADAAGVVITDIFPLSTTFFSATPVGSNILGGGGRRWNIGAVPGNNGGGVITLTLTVSSPQPSGTILTNMVTIAASEPASDTFTATNTISSTPVLDIFKVGLPEPVAAGGRLTYTISYTNTGNDNATGVFITDIFPLSTNYVSSVGSPTPVFSTPIPGGWRWDVPDLAGAGGRGVITLTLDVLPPQPNGTILTNQVLIAANEPASDVHTATNTIVSLPNLNIRKSDFPDPVRAGSVLTYTLTYSNSGNADATGVVITDTLDGNVTFIGATNGGTLNGGAVVWTGLSAPANGLDQTVQLAVTVTSVLSNNSILTNNFAITSNQSSVASTGSITTLVQVPALTVTKTVSPTGFVRAGDNIQFQIIYTNTGPITALNVLITDTFPVSVTNIISSSAEATFQSAAPPVYVWFDSDVPPGGQGTILISGQVITSPWPASGSQITNDVLVVAEDAFPDTGTVSIQGRPGLPSTLTLVALPPTTPVGTNVLVSAQVEDVYGNPVFNGTPITFTVSPIGNITPSGSTSNGLATANLTSTTAGSTTVTAQTAGGLGTVLSTTVVTFTPGPVTDFLMQATSPQTAGFSFPITITAVDAFGNQVTTFNQPVTISDDTGSIIPTPVSLVNGITVTNFTVFTATSPASDTITATDGGATGSVDVEIRAGPPTTLTVTINPTAIQICETADVTTTITDNFGNPVSGQPVTLFASPPPGSVTFSPPSGPTNAAGIFNSVLQGTSAGTVTVLGTSGALSNLTNQPVITITGPAVPISLTLTVSPNPLYTGGNPAIVTATLSDCLGPAAGQVITFTLSDLNLATFATDPFTATTNASGIATATLTSNSTPFTGLLIITAMHGNLVQSTPLDIQLPPTAVLTITKTANPPSGSVVRPGDLINYTLQVINSGTGPASNVVITDSLPAGVTFITGSSSSGSTFSGGSTTLVTIPSLGIGQALTATLQVNVTAATSGTLIANDAIVDSSDTNPITSSLVTHQVVTDTLTLGVYLPLILKAPDVTAPTPTPTATPTVTPTPSTTPIPAADLSVSNVAVSNLTPNTGQAVVLTATLHNTGPAFSTSFWVDLYLATTPINPAPNQTWEDNNGNGNPDDDDGVVPYGVAWKVGGMPANGDTLVVNLNPNDLTETNCNNYSNFIPNGIGCWPQTWKDIPLNNYFRDPGTYYLYVLVDSFDDLPPLGEPTGSILETNEGNNLFGPITITVSGSPLPSILPSTVEGVETLTGEGRLPVRP